MDIYCKKINGALYPSTETDAEAIKGIKSGEMVKVKVTKPRNIQFHRKFFALLNLAYENQEKYHNFEDFRVEVQMRTGHYKEHITAKGKLIYIPKSISFSSVDELTFQKIYSRAIDVILKYFCPGMGRATLHNRVNEILRFG